LHDLAEITVVIEKLTPTAQQRQRSEHFRSRAFREKRAFGERGFDGPFSGQKRSSNRHTVYRV
jgi:hypothetical protein